MLGRLFQNPDSAAEKAVARRVSSLSLGGFGSPPSPPPQEHQNQQSQQNQQQTASSYINEDTFSRTVLYGTPNHLSCIHIDQYEFRLLIVQDKGELLQKNNYKIYFDSAKDHHFDKPGTQRLVYRHAPETLIEFMFGNPIHQDFAVGDRCKVHTLGPLKDLQQSMLITRYFKVQKKVFALGVVTPVAQQRFSEAILSNWPQLTAYLDLIKATFINDYLDGNTQLGPKNLGVTILFKQLTTSIQNLVTTPRLLLGVTHASKAMFNHWCYEMHSWLEIKDGARQGFTGTRFLITLLTTVIQLRNQLVGRDYSDEFVRVVILSTNPIVAQKLIFILSGVLPYKLQFAIEEEPNGPDEKLDLSNCSDTSSTKNYTSTTPEDKTTHQIPSVISKGWEIPTTPSRSIATPSVVTPSRPSLVQPLSTSQSMAYLSSSLQSHSSFSNSLSRGFTLLQNWKNSLDSTSSSNSSSQPSSSYRSPSPSAEYDEYPWNNAVTSSSMASAPIQTNGYAIATPSTATTLQSGSPSNSNFPLSLPRSFSSLEVNVLKKHSAVPRLPHIDRSTSTVYGIGTTKKTRNEILERTRLECRELMNGSGAVDISYKVDDLKGVSIIDCSYEDELFDEREVLMQTPPPLCGYVNEFIPDFQMQACPLAQYMDGKIASSMKRDLHYFNNSRTIYVPLRAREIQDIVMSKGKQEVKTHVKRLYHNGKPTSSCDRVIFAKVDATMEALLAGRDISAMVKDW